jgi:hypothetical protein
MVEVQTGGLNAYDKRQLFRPLQFVGQAGELGYIIEATADDRNRGK